MLSSSESTAVQPPQSVPGKSDVPALDDERIAERVHYLFRRAGDNPPAGELEQQVLAYRLARKEEA